MYTILDKDYAGQNASGRSIYRVKLQVDTAADIPEPEEHWAAGSECEVLENGGAKYRLSNAGEWVQVNFEMGGGGVTEEFVTQKIAEAQLSGGDVDLSAYPLRSEVEALIEGNQVETDNIIAEIQNDTSALRLDCDSNARNLEQVMQEQTRLADDMEEIRTRLTVAAFPRQDASIEGIWMKYAEYSFPAATTYEAAELIMLVRNRVLNDNMALGFLSARLRYSHNDGIFQAVSLAWLPTIQGIDINKFALCYNEAEARAELYVRCDSTYEGYVFTAIAMGTQSRPLDMSAWILEDATEGISELPLTDDGWTTVYSHA